MITQPGPTFRTTVHRYTIFNYAQGIGQHPKSKMRGGQTFFGRSVLPVDAYGDLSLRMLGINIFIRLF